MTTPASFANFDPAGAPGPREAWLPRPYPQLLRGPTFRWWRPLLSLLVLVGMFVVVMLFVIALALVIARGRSDLMTDKITSPAALLTNNLLLAGGIPAAMVAVWAGFGWRPRWVGSVVGGLRWGWLARCGAIALVVAGVAFGLLSLIGWTGSPERQWPGYLAVVLLTTPLQSAGEEYLFRGWLTQVIGSLVPRALVGAGLAAVVSAGLFGLAHGTQDFWLYADRVGFGLIASWLVWRTGGLEASIAMHAASNLVTLVLAVLAGQLTDTIDIKSAGPFVLVDLAVLVAIAVLIDRVAPRYGVRRWFTPPIRVAAPA